MMLRFALTSLLVGATALPASAQFFRLGSVMTLTNNDRNNEVQVGLRWFGHLFPFASYSTGGAGTGMGLGSQSALAASGNHRFVLAVNAGSDSITLFRNFGGFFLFPLDLENTGGDRPTSVAVHRNLVYALNADSDELSGFWIFGHSLWPIGNFPLSGSGVAAAQVGFDPSGRHVVVTERATDQILVYPVQFDGSLGMPVVNSSAAPTPFGFAFRGDGTLVVSEAAGGQAGLSAVSSYEIRNDGSLRTISGAVATTQTAACWIAIPRNGRFAYSTNTGSASVSGFDLDRMGALSLLDPSGVSGMLQSSARPIDADFGASGRILFVLDSANDEVVAFARGFRGGLYLLPGSLMLPDGAAGVIAW